MTVGEGTFKAKIEGDAPSWYDEENDCEGYTTNYGGVKVIKGTGKIDFACIRLGSNYGNTHMTIRIDNQEFQVVESKSCESIGIAELNSSGYPYKHKELPSLDLIEILEMLEQDDNYHYAAILVKKTLISLIIKHIKLNKEEKQALKSLLSIWRKPIITKRQPIITR